MKDDLRIDQIIGMKGDKNSSENEEEIFTS